VSSNRARSCLHGKAAALRLARIPRSAANPVDFGSWHALTMLASVITCPACATTARETMPQDACQHFYRCTGCGEMLKPRDGDCCVFCSYADTPCPSKQGET
jgi:hypothetical protein